MKKVLLIGNPNTGKTTLFNSLTKSSAKTGNWHGVTVDALSKIVKYKNEIYNFIDLPGIYSLTAFSLEEQISIDAIMQNKDALIILVADANSLKRNLYLAMQLIKLNINFKIVINKYSAFSKNGKIDSEKLQKLLNRQCHIIEANKAKINDEILNRQALNNVNVTILSNQSFNFDPPALYNEIENICRQCVTVKKDYVYGKSKFDKIFLNKFWFFPIFTLIIFATLFVTFYLVGPLLSEWLLWIINQLIKNPVMQIVKKCTEIEWIIALFENGIFAAVFTVASFLPQICVLYFFLSIIEESGIMSRIAFMLDEFFEVFGLTGKSAYTLLLGFGCGTTATLTAKNMTNKNAQVKTALLTPYMSCSAKLPVYSLIAGTIFGRRSFLVIIGLYMLGVVVALLLGFMLEKTFLKSKRQDFLIEFPPMQQPNGAKLIKLSVQNAKMFLTKVFSIIFSVCIIVWLLSNFTYNFAYSPNGPDTILAGISSIFAPLFTPLGLNRNAIVTALFVGLVAKELILSSIAISNSVATLTALSASITIGTSPVFFTTASALSFLVFILLYSPCVSNIAVIYKEIGKKYAIFAIITQCLIAYIFAMLTYQLFTNALSFVIIFISLLIIFFAIFIIFEKIRKKTIFKNCSHCKNGNCKNCF